MLPQRCRRWANIIPALGQRLVFDRMYHRKRWREMNGDRLTTAQTETQQTRSVKPVLVWCWASVADGGPTIAQHRVNVLCLTACTIKGTHRHKLSRRTERTRVKQHVPTSLWEGRHINGTGSFKYPLRTIANYIIAFIDHLNKFRQTSI